MPPWSILVAFGWVIGVDWIDLRTNVTELGQISSPWGG